jgi:HrpA-like RNA helicase
MPSVDALSHGLECLYALGAITDQTNLTPRGLQMSAFPTDPQVARMLLESLDLQCSWEVLAVASALQLRPTWLLLPPPHSPTQRNQYHQARSEYVDVSGDHVTMANLIASENDNDWSSTSDKDCRERFVNPFALRRVLEIRRQLSKVLRTFGKVQALGSVLDPDLRSQSIRRCVTAGFFVGNVAKLGQDGRYYTLYGGQHVMVTPSPASVFSSHGTSSEYIIFGETVSHQDGSHHGGISGGSSSSGGGVQVRWCSAIEARWLREIAPHYWQ